MESSASPEPPVRRGPGRPRGAKNRSTLINERKAAKLEAASVLELNKQLQSTIQAKDARIEKKRLKIARFSRELRAKERALEQAIARAIAAEALAAERLVLIGQLQAQNAALEIGAIENYGKIKKN